MPLHPNEFWYISDDEYVLKNHILKSHKRSDLPHDYYNKKRLKPKAIIEGYYIERSGSIEINLKSELIELIVASYRTSMYQMGKLYDQSFINSNDDIKSCFNLNSNTLVSYEGLPNLRPLLVKGLSKGIKIKIRGMFTQEDILNYQKLFKEYTKIFVKHYAKKRGLEICL